MERWRWKSSETKNLLLKAENEKGAGANQGSGWLVCKNVLAEDRRREKLKVCCNSRIIAQQKESIDRQLWAMFFDVPGGKTAVWLLIAENTLQSQFI